MAIYGAVRPKTWEGVHSALFAGDWNNVLRRNRSWFAFRGMESADWGMNTSLMRLGGNYASVERHLLRNFRKYAHRHVADRESFWYWLSVAQHHGLPTRLLDWTYSPYVALHFATVSEEHMDRDGVVWAINIPGLHKFAPREFRDILAREGSEVFTVDMLSSFQTTLKLVDPTGATHFAPGEQVPINDLNDFDALKPEPFALLFEPPSLDDRIVNQYALFSVVSSPTARLDQFVMERPRLYRRIIIAAELKWEIRDRLDQANITERVMYPGLDGLTSWLARHYRPRP